MGKISKYFDKAYCINLDKRPDRWVRVNKLFNDLGFTEIERYPGVDGNLLDLSTVSHNHNLLKGELGILETHINLITEAKNNNYGNILILEDDVIFSNEIYELDKYMNSVPNDWDFIYFGGNHFYGEEPIRMNEKIIKLNHTVALQCIAIKSTIYDKILSLLINRANQVDLYYAQLHKITNAYCFTPNIAKQLADFSDIQNKHVDYSIYFI
jgi:GR25 family glycosyltransferase involved in LPS biosynthesis